ncbi:phosphoribosylformylglycinamidine cyclo-ligase, partial [Corynebacterium amycolatum]|uniref:AIR synthase-related protein n=1 Tax=Corynebacterium amycolatum TaxID=43765 RepID=UPI002119FF86
LFRSTGGGLAGNMVRIMPEGLTADMSRATWTPGPIFKTIAELGNVSREEMEKTFNMGVGMVAIVSAEDRDRALALLTARHINAWELGTVRKSEAGEDGAVLRGSHPRF